MRKARARTRPSTGTLLDVTLRACGRYRALWFIPDVSPYMYPCTDSHILHPRRPLLVGYSAVTSDLLSDSVGSRAAQPSRLGSRGPTCVMCVCAPRGCSEPSPLTVSTNERCRDEPLRCAISYNHIAALLFLCVPSSCNYTGHVIFFEIFS